MTPSLATTSIAWALSPRSANRADFTLPASSLSADAWGGSAGLGVATTSGGGSSGRVGTTTFGAGGGGALRSQAASASASNPATTIQAAREPGVVPFAFMLSSSEGVSQTQIPRPAKNSATTALSLDTRPPTLLPRSVEEGVSLFRRTASWSP